MFPSRWLLVFFVLVANTYAKVHKCSHDHIHSNIDIKKQFIDYKHHPFEYNTNEEFRSRRRELDQNEISESEPEPQPIRIKPYYDPYMISTENGLTESQIEYIKSLISTVIRYYESFVSVIPVSDKLSFDRTCTYWIETEFGINCLEYLEPNQCGMVDLPNQHMNENYLYFHPSNTTRAIKLPSGSGFVFFSLICFALK